MEKSDCNRFMAIIVKSDGESDEDWNFVQEHANECDSCGMWLEENPEIWDPTQNKLLKGTFEELALFSDHCPPLKEWKIDNPTGVQRAHLTHCKHCFAYITTLEAVKEIAPNLQTDFLDYLIGKQDSRKCRPHPLDLGSLAETEDSSKKELDNETK